MDWQPPPPPSLLVIKPLVPAVPSSPPPDDTEPPLLPLLVPPVPNDDPSVPWSLPQPTAKDQHAHAKAVDRANKLLFLTKVILPRTKTIHRPRLKCEIR